jgi:hypothetical protein
MIVCIGHDEVAGAVCGYVKRLIEGGQDSGAAVAAETRRAVPGNRAYHARPVYLPDAVVVRVGDDDVAFVVDVPKAEGLASLAAAASPAIAAKTVCATQQPW